MKKILLAVDCQYDFLEGGSLPVNGAIERMNNLAEFMKTNKYDVIVFTADWHPHEHMSFVENGGQWPKHCVQHTHGAAIYQPLLEVADKTNTLMRVLTKGDVTQKEEYSLMDNYHSSKQFLRIIGEDVEQIDVCGIAGDICVTNTILGLIEHGLKGKLCVLTDFCPSLDDGSILNGLIAENALKSL